MLEFKTMIDDNIIMVKDQLDTYIMTKTSFCKTQFGENLKSQIQKITLLLIRELLVTVQAEGVVNH